MDFLHVDYATACCCVTITPYAFDAVAATIIVAVFQGIRFMTVRYGAAVCCVHIMYACHSIHNEGQLQPTLALNFKGAQYISGTTQANIATLVYIGTPVFPRFQIATPQGFQVNHIPKGKLVYIFASQRRSSTLGLKTRQPLDRIELVLS